MRISLKPWFHKMLRIFNKSIEIKKDGGKEVTERISADRASYWQVKVWGGINLLIIT